MPKPMGSNRENAEHTRAHLLAVATACFAEQGFHQASTNDIITRAKSSRGALYHHFPDKRILFKSVYDTLCQQVAERIDSYPYQNKNPVQDLLDGCAAYLSIFTEQRFARIMLIDAPQVLGMDYCRSKDAETAYKALHQGITEIIGSHSATPMITDFLSGALDTYAMRIATASNREAACKAYTKTFTVYAEALLIQATK